MGERYPSAHFFFAGFFFAFIGCASGRGISAVGLTLKNARMASSSFVGMWTVLPSRGTLDFILNLFVRRAGFESFLRLSRGQTPVKRDMVPLGFRVDNIRFAPDVSILAAGQGQQTTNVVRVDPETLKITELINQPNTESFASGTVAIPIGNDLWVGSFRGDRIAIFPASK